MNLHFFLLMVELTLDATAIWESIFIESIWRHQLNDSHKKRDWFPPKAKTKLLYIKRQTLFIETNIKINQNKIYHRFHTSIQPSSGWPLMLCSKPSLGVTPHQYWFLKKLKWKMARLSLVLEWYDGGIFDVICIALSIKYIIWLMIYIL